MSGIIQMILEFVKGWITGAAKEAAEPKESRYHGTNEDLDRSISDSIGRELRGDSNSETPGRSDADNGD